MKLRMMWMVVACGALAACGGTNGGTDAGGTSNDAGNDAGASVDSGPPDTGAPAPLNGCAEADFIDLRTATADGRMIMVPRGTSTFEMPCITISASQEVMFMWDFSLHPLVAGAAPGTTGGATPSPIQPQTTGMLYTVAFPNAGDYPFYCSNHVSSGMMGVVRVMP